MTEERPGKPDSFEDCVASYGRQVAELLAENRWAFWRMPFWRHAHWARADPELRKILARLRAATDELLRPRGKAGQGAEAPPEIPEATRKRIKLLLQTAPARLTLESAIETFDSLDQILIEIGDEQFVCEEIQGELQWSKGATTWLTWDSVHGSKRPKAVVLYLSGEPIPDQQLEAARRQLSSFRHDRSEDYQVHRARMKLRAKNLRILGFLVFLLVVALGWLLACLIPAAESPSEVALIAVAGALGATFSGTIKARDKLVRGSDLRAFRVGLLAQVFMGAGSALLFYLLLKAGIVRIAGVDSVEGWAAVGFVAGFSEPFVLRTIERVAKMGEEKEEDKPARVNSSNHHGTSERDPA